MNPNIQELLVRRWRFIGAFAIAFAMVTCVLVMLAPRSYVAHGSFLPQGGDASRSRLTGLAAQFGINVPSTDRGQSPDFFAELVRSRTVLDSVPRLALPLTSYWRANGRLGQCSDIGDKDPDIRHDRVREAIDRRLLVTTGLRTGIVSIEFRAPSREAARSVVARLMEQVNRFVVASKQSQAAEEGVFAQERLDEAGQRLRSAEDSLVAFTQANLTMGAPRLQVNFTSERLQRSIEIRQQVFTTITQLYEQARIDAQRATPSIVVFDAPSSLALPLSRHLVSKVGIAGILGAIVALHAAGCGRAAACHATGMTFTILGVGSQSACMISHF